jgi:hypothetical protein
VGSSGPDRRYRHRLTNVAADKHFLDAASPRWRCHSISVITRLIMENQVYLCSWQKKGERFLVWVKRQPSVAAEGESFDEANERLWDAICGTYGDGEAVTEFDPPPPENPRTSWYRRAAVVAIHENSRADVADFQPYFVGGYCPDCGVPRGPRNEVPLVVDRIEAGGDGAFATVPSRIKRGRPTPMVQLYSEQFLELLDPPEIATLTWRRVERRQPRARKVFYELVSSKVHIREVGVRGVPSKFGGWRCRTCGFEDIGHFYFPYSPRTPGSWISIGDLPHPFPTGFTIGKGKGLTLCFLRERWAGMLGKPGTRGLATAEVGVVDADRVQNPTDLPFLDDIERESAQKALK